MYALYFSFCIHYSMLATKVLFPSFTMQLTPFSYFAFPDPTSSLVVTTLFSASMA